MSEEIDNEELVPDSGSEKNVIPVSELYKGWFLDYASYVILERAVPSIEDGLKPVQRRIMHAMKEMDDGRYNKVANIIGSTMQFHPHGDASIGDAIVNLGQKDLLIDTQGNWGDIRTGDRAAAPRYIEARLSKFALEVAFNGDTTVWAKSYDGRKNEPVNLPMKFPLVLVQGVEGIAVGLSTKVMPHNFIELVKGSIKILQEKSVKIFPDFLTGGMMDVSDYNEGKRGGKIRVRARMEVVDKKTIKVTEIPFSTTTTSLVDSIIKANDKGKIKIKKVIDNTARDVEIEIILASGVSPDQTVDALYAFSDCEVSISPNACIIIQDKPHFVSINDLLQVSTGNTKELLRRELEIRKSDLLEKIFFSSLEKIFIQEEMYIDFKEYDNKKDLFVYLSGRFDPFKNLFYREIGDEDYERLTQIPMIRITRFDTAKADEKMAKLEEDLAKTEHHLAHLVDYAIAYFERLLDKYGKGRERKTEIMVFDNIEAKQVAVTNAKLYVNREEGFIGTGIKKDEFICDCSDISDIITIRKDGVLQVSRISDKVFVGKDIVHVDVWKKGDEHMVYNMAYLDGASGKTYIKRFSVTSITRDKEYHLTTGAKGSKMLYLTANPNSESEVVSVQLSQGAKARVKVFEYDLAELAIKGRGSKGNTLTKYGVRKITQKSVGSSTLGGRDLWLDEAVGRFNTAERGTYLGSFNADEFILAVYSDGNYELMEFDLNKRIDIKNLELIQKLNEDTVLSVVHYDGGNKDYYVKRFQIETTTVNKMYLFISDASGSKLAAVSAEALPLIEMTYKKGGSKEKSTKTVELADFIDVKGWKSLGNKLSSDKVVKVKLMEPVKSEEEPKNETGVDLELDVEVEVDSNLNVEETEAETKEVAKESTDVAEERNVEVKKEEKKKVKFKPKLKPKKEESEEQKGDVAATTKTDGVEAGTTIELDVTSKEDQEDKGKEEPGEGEEPQLGLF